MAMRMHLFPLLAGALVLTENSHFALAVEHDPPPASRTDAMGDPLPAGAVARLGSNRFRAPGPVYSLVFGPEDRTLVSHVRAEVLIWDRKTGKEVRRFAVPECRASVFAPGAKSLVLTTDEDIRLWDVAAAKEVWKIKAPPGTTDYARSAFSHDGTKLAVAGKKGVLIHDSARGKTLATLDVPEARGLSFSPDGRLLAVAANNRPIQLWDVARGKPVRDIKTKDDPWYQSGLAFAPDGKTLAWSRFDHIETVAVETGETLARFDISFGVSWLLFPASGRQLISAGQGNGVQVWDLVRNRKEKELVKGSAQDPILALSEDGKTLAVGDGYGDYPQVRLWDVATWKKVLSEPGHELRLNLLAFSADGKTVLTSDPENVLFWDAASGEQRRRLAVKWHYSPAVSADLRRSGVTRSESVELYDLVEGKKQVELKYEGKDAIRFGAFSPNSKQLVTAHNRAYPGQNAETGLGEDGLCIWDLSAGKIVRRLTAEREVFYCGLVLTPDGASAITPTAGGKVHRSEGGGTSTITHFSEGGSILVWDVRAGKESLTLEGHEGAAIELAVSGDSRLLASAGRDRTVRVWELASGKSIHTFPCGEAWPGPVAVSDDGLLLAVALSRKGEPPCIALWDLPRGKELPRLEGFGAGVTSLAFSPDGSRLASAFTDGTALLWDLSTTRRAAQRQPSKFDKADGQRLWNDLGSLDAARGFRAVWALIDAGDEAVKLLKAQLPPVRPDGKRLRDLLAALESEKFAARESAVAELAQLEEAAEPALRQALGGGPSLEARRRMEPLLEYQRMYVNASTVRRRRAIQVLEQIRTAEARQLLRALAEGDPEVRSTQEAVGALKRMGRSD
jgi:WD40 repeat protein